MENENENENGNEVAVQTAITELIKNKLDEAFALHAKMHGGDDSLEQLNDAINDTIGDYDFACIISDGIENHDFDDILENAIDNYDFDYKMENAIENYDIVPRVEDALNHINIGDHVDIDESVQEAIIQWVDNGCDQVNQVAKNLYNRAIGGNSSDSVVLTRNQFDRIMEVVDFIRPAVVARTSSDIAEELIAHTGGDGAEAIKIVSDAVIAKATDEAQVIVDNITKGLGK